MYLSQMWKNSPAAEQQGGLEVVSLGGEVNSVVSSGVQSRKTVFAPGGMCWMPGRGQGVLVVKAGAEDCIVGAEMEPDGEMEPGEVKIFSQGASIWLKNDGSICLVGQVFVNGKELA